MQRGAGGAAGPRLDPLRPAPHDGGMSEDRMISGDNPARAAATLILAREEEVGPPRFLMARRAATMAFAGGAAVFPGGAVDPADRAYARALGLAGAAGEAAVDAAAAEDGAARVAAVRETIEEAGLAVGCGGCAAERGRALRAALCAGEGLAEAASRMGLRFDFAGLVPFARWCPAPEVRHRRFDTRFYLARAPEGAGGATPDGEETTQLAWFSAAEMLDRASSGAARIIFPTRRNLERLAQFDTLAALFAHARAQPVRLVMPWVERRRGVDHACIPEDAGYPVTAEPLDAAPHE